MDDQWEKEACLGLQRGDSRAWELLYERCAPDIWQHVTRLIGNNSQDVADVVQDTFLAAAKSAGSYRKSSGSLKAWLYGIARRQVALHYRKAGQNQRLKDSLRWFRSNGGSLQRWLMGQESQINGLLEAQELTVLVQRALCDLPANYRSCLLAKYVDDLPAQQIAQEMGSSPAAVDSLMARARAAFRKNFAKLTGHAAPDMKGYDHGR